MISFALNISVIFHSLNFIPPLENPEPYQAISTILFVVLTILKPFTFEIVINLFSIGILLFVSGLTSSAEVAFFSLSPSQLNDIKTNIEKHPNQIIYHLINRPKKLLATLVISNNLVNIAIVILSAYTVTSLFDFTLHPRLSFFIQIVIVTMMIVLFGEVMPKIYTTHVTLRIARLVAYPIFVADKILSPLSYLLVTSTNIIDKKISKRGYDITMDELTHAIDITSDKTTPADEKKILKGIVKFGNTDVKQIMKARPDVTAIEIKTPFTQVLKIIEEAGYSRIPVYENNFDRIKGMLYIKDFIKYLDEDDEFHWHELLRPAYFVPESKKINNLLEEFQEQRMHMAIVVDEYGTSVGIVSLEDILEEIVGELSDEFDDEEPSYSKLDDANFVFEAKTLINDVCRVMNIDRVIFNEIHGETDTLAGLVLELAKRIPQKGETVSFRNFKFTIEAADKRRVKRVKVTKTN